MKGTMGAVLGLAVVLACGSVWAEAGADKSSKHADKHATTAKAEKGEGKSGKSAVKTSSFRGQISKIEGSSVTISSHGDSGDKSQIVTVDANTKIMVEADATTTQGAGDKKARKNWTAGKLEDLKVGETVSAAYTEDGKAVRIEVPKAEPAKTGGEGK